MKNNLFELYPLFWPSSYYIPILRTRLRQQIAIPNFASVIFGCTWMLEFGPGPGLGFGIGGPNAKSIVWIVTLALELASRSSFKWPMPLSDLTTKLKICNSKPQPFHVSLELHLPQLETSSPSQSQQRLQSPPIPPTKVRICEGGLC
jgi:hypothetical protein